MPLTPTLFNYQLYFLYLQKENKVIKHPFPSVLKIKLNIKVQENYGPNIEKNKQKHDDFYNNQGHHKSIHLTLIQECFPWSHPAQWHETSQEVKVKKKKKEEVVKVNQYIS